MKTIKQFFFFFGEEKRREEKTIKQLNKEKTLILMQLNKS